MDLTSPLITYHILSNRLRVVHRFSLGEVEYCGITVNVGSRDEAQGREGLAHFVEHTIFKGTARRRSWHIINRMESIGGELNAYTTKEETVVYSVFPRGNLDRAFELQADLIAGSVFPPAEIDREREVVIDEINSYLDIPAEAVYDEFEDLIFAGSTLGHNILGAVETISTFTSQTCRNYIDTFYTPGEMVLFYMGPEIPDRVFRLAERYFSQIDRPDTPRHRSVPPMVTPFDTRRPIDSHQSHTIVGARIPDMYSSMRYAIGLLTNIVGGPGMNSLLNIALREKHGWVYSVDASSTMLTDAGLFTVYFGCDSSDIGRCRRAIANTIDSLAQTAMSARRLDAAKKQYVGQRQVAADNREQTALATARATLYHGRALLPHDTTERIMALTPDDLREAAALIHPDHCSTLTLG